MISELRHYFENKADDVNLPLSLDAVVRSIEWFVRPPEAIPLTPQKAKQTDTPTEPPLEPTTPLHKVRDKKLDKQDRNATLRDGSPIGCRAEKSAVAYRG
jgi:hypothetical protein